MSQDSTASLHALWQQLLAETPWVSTRRGLTLEASASAIRFSRQRADGGFDTEVVTVDAQGKLQRMAPLADQQGYGFFDIKFKAALRLLEVWHREISLAVQLDRDWQDISTQNPRGVKALQFRLEGIEDGIQYSTVDCMDSHDTYVMREGEHGTYTVRRVRITRFGRRRHMGTQSLSWMEASELLHQWRTTVETRVQHWRNRKAHA